MNHALILCRSVTQAQRVFRLLASVGIPARMFRSPVGLTDRGCSYSVTLRRHHLPQALQLLKSSRVRPLKVLTRTPEGGYDEVPWE